MPLGLLATALILVPLPAIAQTEPPVTVIEVSGIIDDALAEFVRGTLAREAAAGAQVAILELDSEGVTSSHFDTLIDFLRDPPLPVVVWVGPAPAQAFGGAGQLLSAASVGAAAPGAVVGHLSPTVAGDADEVEPLGPVDLYDTAQEVTDPIPGLVDMVEPALPQLVAALDGLTVDVGGKDVTLTTVVEDVGPEGQLVRSPVETRFVEPGLGVRLLRIGLDPDVAFFLLVFGLGMVVFEFYALGPGVAAGVALLFLLLGGYGLASMPLRTWAPALCLIGVILMAGQFQRTIRPGVGTVSGLGLLIAGGLALTDAAPQFGPTWWVTLMSAAAVAFLFVIAMPAVAKARLSTPTIGRAHLVGRVGVAGVDFIEGSGTAVIDGARWRASAHRESGLSAGDDLVVTGVDGTFLLVDRAREKKPDS